MVGPYDDFTDVGRDQEEAWQQFTRDHDEADAVSEHNHNVQDLIDNGLKIVNKEEV